MLIYQVYPRSFLDTDGDGVGDLRGITARLDHIAGLGADMVWIGPFFRSPMRDFGYDVSDYRAVDPLFGTLDDFHALVHEARRRGIGVMVDMVVSHTSIEHPWFQQSRLGEADKSDWYLWADARPDGMPPNNWMSVFGGTAWRWDAVRRQYFFHTFLDSQPDLNLHNLQVQDQVLADMAFWLEHGVAGFRLDAVNHYFQDLDLRSNPPARDPGGALHPYGYQEHVYDKNRPEVLPFLERIRALLDRHGAFSVAEVGGADGLRHMIDYVAPKRLHSAYSFELLRTERSAEYVRQVVQTLESSLPASGLPCYALSNHDKPRVATRWGDGREPVAHAKQMLALLACLRGVVCLYQGEELGLPEAEVPFDRIRDPFGKTFWPRFKGRDGCRTPMPWTAGAPHGGFSAAEPWLPVDPRHLAMSVATQDADPDSVLAFARRVFALRRERAELARGSASLPDAPPGVLLLVRALGASAIACAFNLGDGSRSLRAPPSRRTLIESGARFADNELVLAQSGFCLYEIAG
jgi:alpha-glucosidase